jgi:hypothetical protein
MNELEVNGELQALAAELDRAVDGYAPTRAGTLAVARKYRELLWRASEAFMAVPPGAGIEANAAAAGPVTKVEGAIHVARKRVLAVFGTSGWDEPEPSKAAPPAPAIGFREEPAPLTDEELESLLEDAADDVARGVGPAEGFDVSDLVRLAREVRRLRSDEWLLRGLSEAAGPYYQPGAIAAIASILRRHRDGKA